MSGAREKTEVIELQHVSGIDRSVWQAQGSATDVRGASFDRRGLVARAKGVQALSPWSAGNPGVNDGYHSLGVFHWDGSTELVASFGAKVVKLEGADLVDLIADLTPATGPGDAPRFAQMGNHLYITNGKDAGQKWDGRFLSPIGVASRPAAPAATLAEYLKEGVYTFLSFLGGTDVNKLKYRCTWVSASGQESEPSDWSNEIDLNEITTASRGFVFLQLDPTAPSDDIVEMNVYRSTDAGPSNFLLKKRGVRNVEMFDGTRIGEESTDTLAADGANSPPPLSLFVFPFRGRAYYRSVDRPSVLHYSRFIGGAPAYEAVPPTNFLDIDSADGDVVTGWALAQDFAIIFKRRSMFMLSHDKENNPVVRPLHSGVGAVSDRAVASLDGMVFFLSDAGLFMFDGSSVQPLSDQLTDLFAQVPPAGFKDAFAWADSVERKVYFSLQGGPGNINNEVWVVHVDRLRGQGASFFTRLKGFELQSAIQYKSEVYVGFRRTDSGASKYDIGQWGSSDMIGGEDDYEGSIDTRWMTLGDPTATKVFKRLDVVYEQTTSASMTVSWALDWDDRSEAGSTTMSMADPDATLWNDGVWDVARQWDGARLRTKRLDLSDAQGNCIRFRLSLADPWKVVGFRLTYTDHGTQTGGLDDVE